MTGRWATAGSGRKRWRLTTRATRPPRPIWSSMPVARGDAALRRAALRAARLECYVCMERRWPAVSVTCQSCVVPVRDAADPEVALCVVLHEGPVFAAGDVIWDTATSGAKQQSPLRRIEPARADRTCCGRWNPLHHPSPPGGRGQGEGDVAGTPTLRASNPRDLALLAEDPRAATRGLGATTCAQEIPTLPPTLLRGRGSEESSRVLSVPSVAAVVRQGIGWAARRGCQHAAQRGSKLSGPPIRLPLTIGVSRCV